MGRGLRRGRRYPAATSGTALAMPRGPISGFAQAADFYDSVGIAHHPEYLADADMDTAISRIQELNIRHVRLGMYSPANHGARDFYYRSGNFGLKMAAANAAATGSQQPMFGMWGTTEEPLYEAPRGSAVYTIGNSPSTVSSTFLRPLDGPSGTVASNVTGLSLYPFAHTSVKEDFNRAGAAGTSGSLGGNWGNDPFGQGLAAAEYLIVAMPYGLDGFWRPGTGGESVGYWSQATYSGTDLEAHVIPQTVPTTSGAYITVGLIQQPGAGTVDGYQLVAKTDTNQWSLYRWDNGVQTLIAGPVSQSVFAYDHMGIELKNGVVTCYRLTGSGAALQQGRWNVVLSVADTTYPFASGCNIVVGAKDSAMRLENFGGGDISLLENAGVYYNQGWTTAGGLQGPNEPDGHSPQYWDSIRSTLRALKDAKAGRSSTVVLGGTEYVSSATGRITPGPAYANQLPVVAFHLIGNNWDKAGDYTNGADVDVGNRHIYWGGHGPNYSEAVSGGMWGGTSSYTGLPRFVTEGGWYQRTGVDDGPGGQRYTQPQIAGEYSIRHLVLNYAELNTRRTILYKLCDEGAPVVAPWNFGFCELDFTRRASFYAIKNLMALVGWTQGTTSVPITVTNSFTPGSDITLDAGTADEYTMPDRLTQLVLQRSDSEYLIILCRHREIWDRGLQATRAVPDPQSVTLTVAGRTILTAGVAEPAKNPVLDPTDGQTYANAGNGTAYASLTPSGSTVTVTMAGLTRVVKITV